MQSRTNAALPPPLLHALAEKSPPVLWVEQRGRCVAFMALWFDNLGTEPSAQISYWISLPQDVAITRWTESNLLEHAVALAKERGAHLMRVRLPYDDEGRQGALAVQGFEQTDDLLVMQMAVPRQMMPLHIKLRIVWTLQFQPASFLEVAPLHNEAYAEDFDVVRMSKENMQTMQDNSSETWIANVADKPVGFLELSVAPSRVGHIASVGVLKAYRQQGIGTELVLWALEQLSKRGIRTAQLSVRASNTAALRIYRKIGFVPTQKMAMWQQRLIAAPSLLPAAPPAPLPPPTPE